MCSLESKSGDQTLLMALSFMIQLSLKQIKQQDEFNHNIHSFALWLV